MVVWTGRYYKTALQEERRVTQGDPLSPNIFNVVVGAVVRHWVMGVIAEAEARGGWERRRGIRRRYFTPTVEWLPRQTLDGYRAHLTPW